MNVMTVMKDAGRLLGSSVTLTGTIISDGLEVWISQEGVDPLDKSESILVNQPNLFMDYLAGISFMVGGKVPFCLQGEVAGTLSRVNHPRFQYAIEPPLVMQVVKDGEQISVDFSQPPLRVEVI
jgi:hypothetical protein